MPFTCCLTRLGLGGSAPSMVSGSKWLQKADLNFRERLRDGVTDPSSEESESGEPLGEFVR